MFFKKLSANLLNKIGQNEIPNSCNVYFNSSINEQSEGWKGREKDKRFQINHYKLNR